MPRQLLWVFFFFVFFFNSISPSSSVPFLAAHNITLFGDAYFRNNSISLTQDLNCFSPPPSSSSSSFGIGRAFYVDPIRFLDSSTNATVSFSCRFSFTIISSPVCSSGDGIAFLITSNVGSFSLSDGYMGLPEQASNDQDSFFAVEFDTSFDPSLGDINANHIGLDINTIRSSASVDVFSKGFDLKSGKEMTSWIQYRDSEKMIRVWVGNSQVRPSSPLLVAPIDFSMQFKQFMYVGFSASNRRGSAVHVVDHWRFKTFGFLPSLTPMDTVEEGDCLICSPEDSSIENSHSNDHHMDKRVRELALGFGGLAAFAVSVFAVLVIVCFCMIRKRRLDSRCNEGQICKFQGNKVPKRLSLTQIKSATRGFNHNRIIGEGASATVYEGSLPSGGTVAVKRFSQPTRISSLRNPFTNEFATMVGCLRHKHLVQLQGWCCEGNELLLVYEYMPNGSLDKILHKSTKARDSLTWEKRMNIVLGVASALIYLHEECERQIIHRDVKTCNIMLDAEFNAKLGDFGLAEVYEHSTLSTRDATLPAGTMGYLAPEYVYMGVPTVKTDVYSFGVVVLEVASGRKPVDDYGTPVADWVWDLWEKGKLIEAADPKLKGKFNKMEMEKLLMLGLVCVHPNYEKRPTVREAARILRGEAPLPLLPSRKPTVSIRSVLPEGSEEILNFGIDENHHVDDTPWLTPRTHF
ncbi:L-type lectin-domain containing receptor kinase S.6 [Cornus florida]|uniref:L-type lectin-domain containing receptor kinase S.6 n=1 Tax=Cornus florida TaxID=4283 RepID=UPI002897E90C|nr:L-type lectin-domain containing receptor kinase S.6 [Cornus florida]